MQDYLLAFVVFSSLFILFVLCLVVGREFGKWRIKKHPEKKSRAISISENAVLALLALLIAFTFSGAYERFELRKLKIIDEINALDTAYMRIDLLAPQTQAGLRTIFREYLDTQIAIYQSMSEREIHKNGVNEALQQRAKLWNAIISACKITHEEATTMLVVPAFNNVFEIAITRFALTRVHSPPAIFALLIILASLSSFLVGYGTSQNESWSITYVTSYLLIISLTIYIIFDLETPRSGLINVKSFDKLLINARDKLFSS